MYSYSELHCHTVAITDLSVPIPHTLTWGVQKQTQPSWNLIHRKKCRVKYCYGHKQAYESPNGMLACQDANCSHCYKYLLLQEVVSRIAWIVGTHVVQLQQTKHSVESMPQHMSFWLLVLGFIQSTRTVAHKLAISAVRIHTEEPQSLKLEPA